MEGGERLDIRVYPFKIVRCFFFVKNRIFFREKFVRFRTGVLGYLGEPGSRNSRSINGPIIIIGVPGVNFNCLGGPVISGQLFRVKIGQ